MKKNIVFSGLFAASVFSLALVFSLAPAANAQTATTPVACPAGYTCTPIPTQPINCPAGFTCTPTVPTNPSPVGGGGGGGGGITSCYTWSNYLTIGSRGADVTALQQWLIANGYDIPAISQNRTTSGYYGISTAAAVSKLQAAIGQPATGYVGPLTIAYLNQNACGTPTNPTSLNINLTSTPAPSTSGYAMAYKVTFDGTKYDPADVTIELSCSPQVSWTSIGGGKTNTCSNLSDNNTGIDMTRAGDGDYRSTITFYNSSSQPQLVLATAKAWGGVNGKTLVSSDKDAFTLPPTNSTPVSGNGIVASLDPASPLASTVQISTSAQTNNVPLAVFDVKSQSVASTLQSLQLNLNVNNSNGQNGFGALLNSVSIKVGGQTYFGTPSVSTCSAGYTCTSNSGMLFSNMNVALPANVYVPVTVLATIAQDTNGSLDGSSASVSLPTYSIQAVDSNYNSVPVTNSGTISGNTITFIASGVQVPSLKASLDPASPLQSTYSVPQSNVTLAVIDLGAGQNPVTNLNNIQVGSDSTNASSLVSNIRVYMGSTLLGTAPSLTYNGSYYYQWIPVSNVNIPANLGVPLRIVADLDLSSVSSTSTVRVGIAGLNFSGSGANVTGLPVYGSSMYLIPAGGTTQQPTFTITYPIAGSVLQSGQTYNITWTGSDPGVNSYAVYLVGGSLGNTGSIFLGTAYPRGAGDTGTFSWTLIPTQYAPSGFTPGSGYQIQFSGKGVTGANSASFTITSPTPVSQPPVISGGTFPTTLTVGQTGTWSINASDPQNGSLSYNVNWGDAGNYVSAATAGFTQTSSFTHSYSSAGTYTVTFTVKDSAGLSAQTSTTVQVTANVQPTVTITDPKGGETFKFGTPITINWTTTGITGGNVGLYLESTSNLACSIGNPSALADTITLTLQSNQPCPGNSYFPNLIPGQYKVMIDAAPATGIENTGGSSNYFNIIPATIVEAVTPPPAATTSATVTYSCPSGYTLNSNNTCSSTSSPAPSAGAMSPGAVGPRSAAATPTAPQSTTVNATPNYSCPTGYTLSGTTCTGPTSMNTSATQPASAAQSSGWSSFLKFLGF